MSKLDYTILNYLDESQIEYHKLNKYDVHRDCLVFATIYSATEGNYKKFAKHMMSLKGHCDRNSIFTVFTISQIPFDNSLLPNKYYQYIKDLCHAWLLKPMRFNSIESWVDFTEKENLAKLN